MSSRRPHSERSLWMPPPSLTSSPSSFSSSLSSREPLSPLRCFVPRSAPLSIPIHTRHRSPGLFLAQAEQIKEYNRQLKMEREKEKEREGLLKRLVLEEGEEEEEAQEEDSPDSWLASKDEEEERPMPFISSSSVKT